MPLDPIPNPDNLTDKQITYCHEYIKDLNGPKAAQRAGYAKNSSADQSSKLQSKPSVREYIEALQEQIYNRLNLTTERILEGFLNEADGSMPDSTPASRVAAWNALAKHKGFFAEDNAQQTADVKKVLDRIGAQSAKQLSNAIKTERERRTKRTPDAPESTIAPLPIPTHRVDSEARTEP